MQNFNLTSYLKTVQHFQMKLGTHVPRNSTHIYTRSHNSGLTNYSVIPLFGLKKQTSVGTHSAVLLLALLAKGQRAYVVTWCLFSFRPSVRASVNNCLFML